MCVCVNTLSTCWWGGSCFPSEPWIGLHGVVRGLGTKHSSNRQKLRRASSAPRLLLPLVLGNKSLSCPHPDWYRSFYRLMQQLSGTLQSLIDGTSCWNLWIWLFHVRCSRCFLSDETMMRYQRPRWTPDKVLIVVKSDKLIIRVFTGPMWKWEPALQHHEWTLFNMWSDYTLYDLFILRHTDSFDGLKFLCLHRYTHLCSSKLRY